MSGTGIGKGQTPKDVFINGNLSKFSQLEHDFIYGQRGNYSANQPPNGTNIGTARALSTDPNEKPFKIVIPTYDKTGKITGYYISPSTPGYLKKDGLNGGGFIKELIELAKRGEIPVREVIFAIRLKYDMADGKIELSAGPSNYGDGTFGGNTSFYNSDVSKQLERNNKARRAIYINNAYDIERQRGLETGEIIETYDSDGKVRYLKINKTAPQTSPDRQRLFVPDYGDIFEAKDQVEASKNAEELDFMISTKYSRLPGEERSRSTGPRPNFFHKLPYKDNPDGSRTYDPSKIKNNPDKGSREINDGFQGSLYSLFDLSSLASEQLVKWFVDPISGAPKSATLIAGALDKYLASSNTSPSTPAGVFISNYQSHSHDFIYKVIGNLDKVIIGIKVFKKVWAAAKEGNLDNAMTWINPAKSPLMPIVYYFIGKFLKDALIRTAGTAPARLAVTGPVATAILVGIDGVITAVDLYVDYRKQVNEAERLRNEAEKAGWLSGPYIETGGKIKIPVLTPPKLDDPLQIGDPTMWRKIPIGVQRDKDGNTIYEKVKYIDESTGRIIESNIDVKVPDPRYPNDRTKDRRVPKFIYPKTPNIEPLIKPMKPPFSPNSWRNRNRSELIGVYIDGNLALNSYNDFDENKVNGYISTYCSALTAALRASDFARKSKQNEQNGLRFLTEMDNIQRPSVTFPDQLRSSEIDTLAGDDFRSVTVIGLMIGLGIDYEQALNVMSQYSNGYTWVFGGFSTGGGIASTDIPPDTSGVIDTIVIPETSPVRVLNGNVDDGFAGYDKYGNPNNGS